MLAREVMIPADQDGVPDPHTVVRFDAGSLVIAGTSRLTAWAIKANFDGNAQWKYASGILSQRPGSKAAEFNGAVPLDDGTTLLCGNLSGARPYSPGLLTRIDANGHLLSERPVYPQGRSDHGIASLRDCVRWGDGVLALGNVIQFEAGKTQKFYWLVMLDRAGERSWEKLVPTTFDSAIQPIVTANSRLIFFEHGLLETEITKIASTGEVEGQRALPGNWMPTYKKTSSDELDIYGESGGKGTTISLDEHFNETARQQYVLPSGFSAGFVYRMSDQAITLVGRGAHREAQVCQVDSGAGTVNCLTLNRPPFIEAALLTAVVPLWDTNEILSVRPLLRQLSDSPMPTGLALDFTNAQ